jgi:Flp pilus assembly protein TadG
MNAVRLTLRDHDRQGGQALVEFSLAIMVFIVMIVGLFDVGRGVYTYNGVSEAAREIARITAVHTGVTLGSSDETVERVAVQQSLTPGMNAPTFGCVNVDGSASSHSPCQSGDYVRVTVTATYRPLSLLGIGGPINLSASSSIRIP